MRKFLLVMSVIILASLSPRLAAGATIQTDSTIVAPEKFTEKINASVIRAKLPKRLRTREPFWGTPVEYATDPAWTCASALSRISSARATHEYGVPMAVPSSKDMILEDSVSVWMSNPLTGIADWVCWNADLADMGGERDRFLRRCTAAKVHMDLSLWVSVINECYKWAWSKPYGNVNIVCGPMYNTRVDGEITKESVPYAFFAVVCKKVASPKVRDTGFRSVGFVIPNNPSAKKTANVYDYSRTVNNVEYFTGYDFFPKLPASVAEVVEEMTVYELFCPFVEDEEQAYEEDEIVLGDMQEMFYDSFQSFD